MTKEPSYDRMKRWLRLKTDPITDDACRYLESRGFEFCVDFGTDNAIDLAAQVITSYDA